MKNSFWIGLLVGLCAPAVAFILTEYTRVPGDVFPSQPLFVYAIAAGINLILVRVFYKREEPREQVAKGILLLTFLVMLLFLFVYKLQM